MAMAMATEGILEMALGIRELGVGNRELTGRREQMGSELRPRPTSQDQSVDELSGLTQLAATAPHDQQHHGDARALCDGLGAREAQP